MAASRGTQVICAATPKPRMTDRGFFLSETTTTKNDLKFLERALELAENGLGRTSPNPLVGAVIVKDGRVLGEGWHDRYGAEHAEINALAACDDDPAGTTMYVSLEPCCHEGKTPACTDAIIQAGLKRVVVGSDDPSDKASGRGLGILRDEGIEITVAGGEVAAAARLINQPFRKHARTGRPHVVFKSAATLDGRVATETGESRWITAEGSRALVHRWRAQVDAVCVGSGTATADDPLLTARSDGTVTRQPSRVVFDSEARLSTKSRLMATVNEAPVIVVTTRAAKRADLEQLENIGAQVVVVSGQNEAARVMNALQALGAEGIQSLLLEGGPHLAGAFLDAGEIDEFRVFLAPIAIGGHKARAMLEGEGSKTIEEGMRALSIQSERIGDDILIKARMREW